MNREVFLSILAMDSYQRGYEPGIKGVTGTQIGAATITHDSSELIKDGQRQDIPAGFYAVSYTVAGGVEDIPPGTTNYGDSCNNPQTSPDAAVPWVGRAHGRRGSAGSGSGWTLNYFAFNPVPNWQARIDRG
jgi:hypothetical protein